MNEQAVIATVRRWVESVVVDLNLCPFARRELVENRVRFVATDTTEPEQLLQALQQELQCLESDEGVETSLLIHPEVLKSFAEYNQFLDLADHLLMDMGLEGVYQIASFHPQYQFAGTEPDDAENYSNRAPYPLLHILREVSLDAAIDGYPDTETIPQRNIERLNRMGAAAMQARLEACFEVGANK